ncbi:MAG: hypothetical protein AAF222_02600 [Pseudomonadota bacterium]
MSTNVAQLEDTTPAAASLRSWSVLAIIWLAFSTLILAPGHLVITSHWGDAMHLVDILDRMSHGQKPHIDFVTPLGELAFWPVAALMDAGLPTGRAFLIVQIILAGGLAAAALAVASLRMPKTWALVFACAIMVTTLAVTHGRPELSLSINVHYNRWCWALAFVALVITLIPSARADQWEGVLVGGLFALLALIKVTYFVAFLPLAILGLVLTRQTRLLIPACATGIGIALILTLFWGFDYWLAYASDVLYVASAAPRPNAGHGLVTVLSGPYMLSSTVLAGFAVFLLYREGLARHALLFVCTFLTSAYVSDQNAGHDPLFLGFAALLLLVWAKDLRGPPHLGLIAAAFGFVIALAPNVINLASSPLRAVLADPASFVPLVIGSDRHQDILIDRRAVLFGGQTHFATDGQRTYFGQAASTPFTFLNEPLPTCESQLSPSYFASIADDLKERNLAQGQTIFVADFLSPLWLFGNHPPLEGAAPWSYGGLHGARNADFVLVPVCPNRASVYRRILSALDEAPMTELVRTPLYRLFVW